MGVRGGCDRPLPSPTSPSDFDRSRVLLVIEVVGKVCTGTPYDLFFSEGLHSPDVKISCYVVPKEGSLILVPDYPLEGDNGPVSLEELRTGCPKGLSTPDLG